MCLVKFPPIVVEAVGFIKAPSVGLKTTENQKTEAINFPFGIFLNQLLNGETSEETPKVKNSSNLGWAAFLIHLLGKEINGLKTIQQHIMGKPQKGNKIEINLKEDYFLKNPELEFFLQKLENSQISTTIKVTKISLLKKFFLKTNKGEIQKETFKGEFEKINLYKGFNLPTQPMEEKTPSAQKIAKTAKVPPNLENHTKVFRIKIPLDRDTVLLIKATKHHFSAVIKTTNENFVMLQGGLQNLAESIVSLGFTSATLRLQAVSAYGRVKNATDNSYDNNRGKNGEPHPLKDRKNPFGPLFGGGSLSFFL